MGNVISINLPNVITITVMVALGYALAVLLYQLLGRAIGVSNNPGQSAFSLFGTALNRNAVG